MTRLPATAGLGVSRRQALAGAGGTGLLAAVGRGCCGRLSRGLRPPAGTG